MNKILVVGGAGYIGSHMTAMLSEQGYQPIVLDNLSSGFTDAVIPQAELITGDLADQQLLNQVFSAHKFSAVMHFAALIQVGESVTNPAKYYRNNVANTLNLLETMLKFDVKKFIFSSSAAIYGEPKYTPIDENHPKTPVNPYGRSKLMIEEILADFTKAYDFRAISLRYFNASGADPLGRFGERHDPETHLIPLILQAASSRGKAVNVFGKDYPTADGTCIRDYVHVVDLCSAHLLGLKKLLSGGGTCSYNLGNGNGFSVSEVINTARDITQCNISVNYVQRREGDPAVLVADAHKVKEELAWRPQFSSLRDIVSHAWLWEQKLAHLQ